jgi:NAD(P) transhydrogenase subunit alpha
MSFDRIIEETRALSEKLQSLSQHSAELSSYAKTLAQQSLESGAAEASPFMMNLTVFALACFVGYYVVWKVTPALHSPLMSITNAISSVIIVGALMAAGLPGLGFGKFMGLLAVILASINIFGGFIVTQRMLEMFNKKKS